MTDLERLARVLASHHGTSTAEIDEVWTAYVPEVRAILQELMEPSDGMMVAANIAMEGTYSDAEAFKAAIAHILSQEPKP